jgi:hypothetical protein
MLFKHSKRYKELIVPSLCVGMRTQTLRVPIQIDAGASKNKLPRQSVTAIKLRKKLIKNNAFSAVYGNLVNASQMTFCEVGCDVFVQW